MSLVAYTLLMFGCADDGSACERLASPPQVYSASATCQAQIEPALQSDIALRADYPSVEARCVKVSKQASSKVHSTRIFAVR